jgi:protein SCO1/2
VVPVFITVDPERDTPPTIGQYVKLFDERLVGLTGTPAEIAAMARAYRVYYAKARPKGSDTYLMDHSSFSYLVGPDGRFRSLIRPGLTAEAMAADIEKVIGGD